MARAGALAGPFTRTGREAPTHSHPPINRHLVNTKFFVAAHCVVVWVTVLWGTATCIPCTHGRTFCSLSLKWNLTAQPCSPLGTYVMFIRSTGEPVLAQQVVFYKGHSREMGSQRPACACQASYQKGKTTTQECCPKPSSGKWRACARVQGEVELDQEILHRAGQGVGLRTLAAL